MNNLSFAGTGVNEFLVPDIDCSMVDAAARIALEENEIAYFQIVDGIDPRPIVVSGVGVCIASADPYAAFVQAVVYQSGTVKRVRTFVS